MNANEYKWMWRELELHRRTELREEKMRRELDLWKSCSDPECSLCRQIDQIKRSMRETDH